LNASPDFQALEKIEFGLEPVVKGVSLNTNDSDEYDIVSRYFTPWNGINEDPVNGSSHTVLSVYWANKLNKKKLKAYQASVRGGEMELEILESNRVAMKGYAVTVMEGKLKF
jgi:PhzF family phenazine biosynthesis protein